MRHAQRALLILVEQMFFDGHELTDEQRGELEVLAHGAVKEVFRVFVRATFGDEDVDADDRKRLVAIAAQLRLPEEVVPQGRELRAA